jgi:hypothetical protein
MIAVHWPDESTIRASGRVETWYARIALRENPPVVVAQGRR